MSHLLTIFYHCERKYFVDVDSISTPLGSTLASVRPRLTVPISYLSRSPRAFAEPLAGVSPPRRSPLVCIYYVCMPTVVKYTGKILTWYLVSYSTRTYLVFGVRITYGRISL